MIKFLHRHILGIITIVARLIVTVSASAVIANGMSAVAYRERGYYAIGGEWIIIIAMVVVTWLLTGYAAKCFWIGGLKIGTGKDIRK